MKELKLWSTNVTRGLPSGESPYPNVDNGDTGGGEKPKPKPKYKAGKPWEPQLAGC